MTHFGVVEIGFDGCGFICAAVWCNGLVQRIGPNTGSNARRNAIAQTNGVVGRMERIAGVNHHS
ncbi:hypothetical protein [Paraburkholderia sp.]|uniref:hypothetical protein n=1 Tax=Paraburkholderia sp. TaxID=1926495 RepID=UPI00286EB982|nr:hypothetical protein [Paraburkholderia sp.]